MICVGHRVVALFAAAILAHVLVACSAPDSMTSVSVLGPWTHGEQQNFEKVLNRFTRDTGVKVIYQGARAVNEELSSRVQNGTSPDVAILFSPGEVGRYLRNRKLNRLDNVIDKTQRNNYTNQWQKLESLGTENLYGVVVKANLKSIIWYNPKYRPGGEIQNWDQVVAWSGDKANTGGRPWCMGMGSTPTSGWPGTDWIEDILLHEFGTDIYQQWSSGRLPWTSPQIREAWERWGTITATVDRRSVLLTDWSDAGRPMFANPTPGCFLDHEPSFAIANYQTYDKTLKPGNDFDFLPFPAFGASRGMFEVSADMATMFNDTPQARRLIRYLATADAQRIWPHSGGGAFSVNSKVNNDPTVYPDQVSLRIAQQLTTANVLCYDAGDLMPATMRNAFYRGVLEYLSDPKQLTQILTELDEVRRTVEPEEWLDIPCGQ
jgi:alpha-glucoside transport system substrate-binding protein